MSASPATTSRNGISTRLARRLAGLASAVALTVLLTGNVAAYQLDRDDHGSSPLVTPRVYVSTVSAQWISLKLATTAGHKILVFG